MYYLKIGTDGMLDGDCDVGDVVTVQVHDEDGLPVETTGEVAAILDITFRPTRARN